MRQTAKAFIYQFRKIRFYDITLVLGTAAIIHPISILLPVFIAALLFAIIANILLFYVAGVKKQLRKFDGMTFLLLYVLYIALIFYLQISELHT